MTKEEAILRLKRQADGYYPKLTEAPNIAIKALEKKPILDKIRAEIEDLDRHYDNDYFSGNKDAMFKCSEVLEIIDKYKAESEGKE